MLCGAQSFGITKDVFIASKGPTNKCVEYLGGFRFREKIDLKQIVVIM